MPTPVVTTLAKKIGIQDKDSFKRQLDSSESWSLDESSVSRGRWVPLNSDFELNYLKKMGLKGRDYQHIEDPIRSKGVDWWYVKVDGVVYKVDGEHDRYYKESKFEKALGTKESATLFYYNYIQEMIDRVDNGEDPETLLSDKKFWSSRVKGVL